MRDARSPRICRMLDDEDLSGDLLLVGLAFARFLDYGGLPAGEKLSTRHVAACCWPNRSRNHAMRTMKAVLQRDARTYKPEEPLREKLLCDAPMIRRSGPCGRSYSSWGYLTDWETGEKTRLVACSRHREWFSAKTCANYAEKPDHPPLPAANHGGVLARHIPEFRWPKVWAWASGGRWVEHPEVTPWRKPTLTLILGDGDAG